MTTSTIERPVDPQRYVHEHDDWADGDCTRCLRLETYYIQELGHKGRSWQG